MWTAPVHVGGHDGSRFELSDKKYGITVKTGLTQAQLCMLFVQTTMNPQKLHKSFVCR